MYAALFAWLLAAPVSDRDTRRSTSMYGIAVGVALWVILRIVIAHVPSADIFGGAYIRHVIILFCLFLYAFAAPQAGGGLFAVATWLITAAVASIFNSGACRGRRRDDRTSARRDHQRYYTALILVVVATGVVWWLLRSRYRLALTAVRDDDEGASSIGIDIRRVKTVGFVVSAPMAAIAAGLYYIDQVTITPPDAFHIRWSAYVVFVGGRWRDRHPSGPLIGACCSSSSSASSSACGAAAS